jgi:hypothetical protein
MRGIIHIHEFNKEQKLRGQDTEAIYGVQPLEASKDDD